MLKMEKMKNIKDNKWDLILCELATNKKCVMFISFRKIPTSILYILLILIYFADFVLVKSK